ncbi:MAG: hypothetical protein J5I93_30480 [Pirellulaceae bacterium]|nr:hypothetical protein [Pirellulaceae bacterium]
MLGMLLIAGSLVVVVGQAPAEAPRDLEAAVRRLVRQLDSSELAARDEAERALIELGPGVLDYLPRITARTPAEVKERLGRVAQAVEKVAAEAVGKASRVTLEGEMSLADAIAGLTAQTGNRLTGYEDRSAKVNLKAQDATFWETLDQILDQASLTINPFGGRANMLTVQSRPEMELPRYGRANYSGPFRFEAIRVQTRRDLRNPEVQGMQVTVDISWEPRNTPILISQPLAELSARDEDGVAIEVDGQGARGGRVSPDISSLELDLPFQLPERGVSKIARLKGTLSALVPGRVESFEFDNLLQAKDVEKRRASVTVILEGVRKNGDLYEALVRVRYDEAANALESHREWIYNNDVFMLDAKGRRVEFATLNTTRQEPNEVGIGYLFALESQPADYKFVYRTPAVIINSRIDYELNDIDLP